MFGAIFLTPLEDVKTLSITQANIRQDQFERSCLQLGDNIPYAGGCGDLELLVAEPSGHRLQEHSVVIHQKQRSRFHDASIQNLALEKFQSKSD